MRYDSKSGFMFELILGLVVLAILLVAEYLHAHKAALVGPTPTPITRVVISTAPGVSVTPATTATPLAPPSFIYDISDLALIFAAPGRLKDLDSTAVYLAGDQAVNSVGFSSKRLEAAGCSASSAPLGIITYDTDKGGEIVAHVGSQNIYYIEPKTGCRADASLLPLASLKAALGSVVSGTLSAQSSR